MTFNRLICMAMLLLAGVTLRAQQNRSSIEIDYNNPQKYIVGGVDVEGNQYFNARQILSQTGLQAGMEVTVPGEDMTSIVTRLVAQRYFEDVAVVVDSLCPSRDTAWFKIVVRERPRVSRWTFTGVKTNERKDLQERLNLRAGRE
ncbi:MAG: hypothetical protein IKX05_04955, partial [Bacteroidales bacterium]|nr:hypothetical protein [Bacteroidales bacterium]